MFNIPGPDLQINFSAALSEIRGRFLQNALKFTVEKLEIKNLDEELAAYVPNTSLASLASQGLRGELLFSVPIVIIENPRLLGYYRLLYGFSQKEFYTKTTGLSIFQSMEKQGKISLKQQKLISELCKAMSFVGVALLEGIGAKSISSEILDDLTLLTLGPQLRGGANVKKGAEGIVKVFNVIHEIVKQAVIKTEKKRIEIKNAAGRQVLIEFASDPDIKIREEMSKRNYRKIIAIEVKGGSDFSNIHNRIGEAEKSHQKAKASGYIECWTVLNVAGFDESLAHLESPSTNRFYLISDLENGKNEKFLDFRDRVLSLTGVPGQLD